MQCVSKYHCIIYDVKLPETFLRNKKVDQAVYIRISPFQLKKITVYLSLMLSCPRRNDKNSFTAVKTRTWITRLQSTFIIYHHLSSNNPYLSVPKLFYFHLNAAYNVCSSDVNKLFAPSRQSLRSTLLNTLTSTFSGSATAGFLNNSRASCMVKEKRRKNCVCFFFMVTSLCYEYITRKFFLTLTRLLNIFLNLFTELYIFILTIIAPCPSCKQ